MTAAVPGPRFRDQLAEETARHSGNLGPRDDDRPDVWFSWCECGWDGGEYTPRWRERYHQHIADVLLLLIAAEVEARVQAAANQRAAEELEAAAAESDSRLPDGTGNGRAYNSYRVAAMLRDRAAALEAGAGA